MQTDFHKKHENKIAGTLSCFDRVIIHGSLSKWGFTHNMNSYLITNKIKVKDYLPFAKEQNILVRQAVEATALENELPIEHIRSPHRFDKEKYIQQLLAGRGEQEGIVCIFSSMEICDCYDPTFDRINHKAYLKYGTSKCLHYYIYFIDRLFGLCYLRIPTWIPFRLQFYFNGHNYLAKKLSKESINFHMSDNAFDFISDFQRAQELSDAIRVEELHAFLDLLANRYLPFLKETFQIYRWTITQAEYATDLIFKRSDDLRLLYDQLVLNAIHAVKPNNIATFFSRKLAANYHQQVGNKYNTQIQGTRIKHAMGVNSIKMYDKDQTILRIETTVNDITEFIVFRDVVHRDGKVEKRYAPMKKTIYSLFELAKISQQANARYLDFIAAFDDASKGQKRLDVISSKVSLNQRSYRGFNLFDASDAQILLALESGEFNIYGFRNKSLRLKLNGAFSSSAISRILKRLLLHGLIKKIKNTYKYYLTKLAKRLLGSILTVKEQFIIPALAA